MSFYSLRTVVVVVFLIGFSFVCSGVLISSVHAGSMKNTWEEAAKNIVRLPPSAFPELPKAIVQELNRRACSIPQAWEALNDKTPHNVISGEFQKSGQTDWAVLCSVDGHSVVLVFWKGMAKNVEEVPNSLKPDQSYLQMWVDQKIQYSRNLSSKGESYIIEHYEEGHGKPPPFSIDHEGIDNASLNSGSTIYYWRKGEWLELPGAD